MTAMPKFKTDVTTTTTDVAYVGGHVVRMFEAMCCPHCLAQLHASAWCDAGEGEYAWVCQRCHRDVISIRAY